MTKIIQTVSELRALKKIRFRLGIRSVEIGFPGPAENRLELEKKINRELNSCGCEMGGIFVGSGLLLIILAFMFSPGFDLSSAVTWAGMIGFLLVMALTGKITGLTMSARRLNLAISKYESTYATYE